MASRACRTFGTRAPRNENSRPTRSAISISTSLRFEQQRASSTCSSRSTEPRNSPSSHCTTRPMVRRYSRVDKEFVDELTMPLGTFRFERGEAEKYGYYVGVPHLWRSLVQQLASEYVAQYTAAIGKHEKLLTHAVAHQPELGRIAELKPYRRDVPRPPIFDPLACGYECDFTDSLDPWERGPLCSNKCEYNRSNQLRRQAREENRPTNSRSMPFA